MFDTMPHGRFMAMLTTTAALLAVLVSAASTPPSSISGNGMTGSMCFGGWDRLWCVGDAATKKLVTKYIVPEAVGATWTEVRRLSAKAAAFPMVGPSVAGYGQGWLVVCEACTDHATATASKRVFVSKTDVNGDGVAHHDDDLRWLELTLPTAIKFASVVVTGSGCVIVAGGQDEQGATQPHVYSFPLAQWPHDSRWHVVAIDTMNYPIYGSIGRQMPAVSLTADTVLFTVQCPQCAPAQPKYPLVFNVRWSATDPVSGGPQPGSTVAALTPAVPRGTVIPTAQCSAATFASTATAQCAADASVGFLGVQQGSPDVWLTRGNTSDPMTLCEHIFGVGTTAEGFWPDAVAISRASARRVTVGKSKGLIQAPHARLPAAGVKYGVHVPRTGGVELGFILSLPGTPAPGTRARLATDGSCTVDVPGTKPWLLRGAYEIDRVFVPRAAKEVVLCIAYGTCAQPGNTSAGFNAFCAQYKGNPGLCTSALGCCYQQALPLDCYGAGITADEDAGGSLDRHGMVSWFAASGGTARFRLQTQTVTLSRTWSESKRTMTHTGASPSSTHSAPSPTATVTASLRTHSVSSSPLRYRTHTPTRSTVSLSLVPSRSVTALQTVTANLTWTVSLARSLTLAPPNTTTTMAPTTATAVPSATTNAPPNSTVPPLTTTLAPTTTVVPNTSTVAPPPPPPSTTSFAPASTTAGPSTTTDAPNPPATVAPSTTTAAPTTTAPATHDDHHGASGDLLVYVALAAGCGVAVVLAAVGGRKLRAHLRQRHLEDAARTPLLGAGGTSPRGGPMSPGSPSLNARANESSLAGLQGCTIVRTLRRDPHRMTEVLIADRNLRQPTANSSRRLAASKRLAVHSDGPAAPATERVVIKRCVCETGRDRSRALTEFMLLQRVFGRSRGKVVQPLDIMVSELVSADGRLQTLRDVARGDIDAEGRALDVDDDDDEASPQRPPPPPMTLSMKRLPNPFLVSIVMTYYTEGDLQAYLDAFNAAGFCVPEHTIVAVAQQVASALATMHSKFRPALVHGDVKPSNIVIDRAAAESQSNTTGHTLGSSAPRSNRSAAGSPSGKLETRLLLADFGCARRASASATTGGPMTHKYAAPECFTTGAPLTPAVDIFAVGVSLLQLALGEPPSQTLGVALVDEGKTAAADSDGVLKQRASEVRRSSFAGMGVPDVLRDDIERVIARGYTQQLVELIVPLLHPDPADRPNATSLREMAAEMIGGSGAALHCIPTPPSDPGRLKSPQPSASSCPEEPMRIAVDESSSMTSAGREMRH